MYHRIVGRVVFMAGVMVPVDMRVLLRTVYQEFVQLVHINIGQDWTDAGPLRRAAIAVVVLPLLHITGFQHFLHELDKLLVLNSLFQDINKYMVVEVVKAALDTPLDHPPGPRKAALNFKQRRMAASLGAESVINLVPFAM